MIINKRRLGWCFLGLIPLFLSPACGPREPGWQGRVEVHDGVTVVMNPAIPLYPDAVLELEDDLTIAGSEEDEQQILQNIVILDVDTGGRIYVLDEQAGNIKLFGPETYDVFDSDGRYAARVRLEVPNSESLINTSRGRERAACLPSLSHAGRGTHRPSPAPACRPSSG